MSAMLFALIFPRAQLACTFDISAEWLQSALRSFAIVCDYMDTALFSIVCDPRSSAIVCDHMETSLNTIILKEFFYAVVSHISREVIFKCCERFIYRTERLKITSHVTVNHALKYLRRNSFLI